MPADVFYGRVQEIRVDKTKHLDYSLETAGALGYVLLTQCNAHEEQSDLDRFFNGTVSTWVELATDCVFRGESETNDGEIPSGKIAVT